MEHTFCQEVKEGFFYIAIYEKPPEGFKDINEMHCAGSDIPSWFCRLVEKHNLL